MGTLKIAISLSKKLIFSLLLSSFFILVYADTAFPDSWPFKNTTSDQQKIRQTLGAYRDSNRFHNGVDIVPQDLSDQKVYSITTGKSGEIQYDGEANKLRGRSSIHQFIY